MAAFLTVASAFVWFGVGYGLAVWRQHRRGIHEDRGWDLVVRIGNAEFERGWQKGRERGLNEALADRLLPPMEQPHAVAEIARAGELDGVAL